MSNLDEIIVIIFIPLSFFIDADKMKKVSCVHVGSNAGLIRSQSTGRDTRMTTSNGECKQVCMRMEPLASGRGVVTLEPS